MRTLVALPLVVWSTSAAASFHPVVDRPYRYETVETRTADGVMRQFRASRTVVFQRTDMGYDVTITLDAVDQQAGGDVGRMFLAATGALLHRPLLYRLDAAGAVLDVVDADTAITRIADAIEQMAVVDRDRRNDSLAMASPLRTLPPERKRAMLMSIVTPLLAGPAAARPPGRRPISVSNRPPLVPGTALSGIESISLGSDGIVTVTIDAIGAVDATVSRNTPGAGMTNAAGTPTATIRTVRNLDPASGLVRDSRDMAETEARYGTAVYRTRIETVVTLRPTPK